MNKQWEIFKNTWTDIIEKKQSNLFRAFDSYINSEIWKDKDYVNKIETILVINKKVDAITLKDKTLYVYQSPFYILINNNQLFPSGFIMENIITCLIKSIVNKSSSTINIIRDYHHHHYHDEEEEEEEEVAAAKAIAQY